jgi:hypothetical protein
MNLMDGVALAQINGKVIVMSKLPPVPPDNRSPKGPGADPQPDTGSHAKGSKNIDQQGQTANTKQNTTNQGYKQDR